MNKRRGLRQSRYYYWFVVLAGIAGGYCIADVVKRRPH